MEFRWLRGREETYDEMRRRIIAETSAYLTECLTHPEYALRIPTIPAGDGRFPPSFTAAFWDAALSE